MAVLRMGEVVLSSDEYGLALGTSPTPYPVILKFLICPFKAPLALLVLLLAVLRMGEVGLSSDKYGLALVTSPTSNPVIFKFLICPFVPF